MSKNTSFSVKGIHPRLKARMDAKQVDLFGGEASDATTKDASVADEAIDSTTVDDSQELLSSAELAPPSAAKQAPRPVTVSDLCKKLKLTLKNEMGTVYVQGEIADFKGIHRSGHLYCSLKDDSSQVRLVMWKGALEKIPFEIKGGLEVIVRGKIDFYGGSGSLQINAERIEPVGVGALQLKFEQLKEKLEGEGLFAEERKRPIPAVCWRVGLVTGKSTAALQDMLKIFKQRFPLAEIFLFHASVQGDRAPGEIVSALSRANRLSKESDKPLDVIIVGRGGGSYEDLFCFNDEKIARAIVASNVPIVSAVGHEIDFTIADFVSDRRSATPTHAAQEVVPDQRAWFERLENLGEFFEDSLQGRLDSFKEKVDYLYNRMVAMAPQKRIANEWGLLKMRRARLEDLMRAKLADKRSLVSRGAAVLDAVSPLKVFERGYSMATGSSGKAVKSVSQIKSGEPINIAFVDGSVEAVVKNISKTEG